MNPRTVTLFLSDAPYSSHSGYDAYHYAKELLENGQAIESIFFFSDSVYLANGLAESGYDEFNLAQAFLELSEQKNIKLNLCVGACQKRGILDDQMANQRDLDSNVIAGFDLVGLVRLYQSIIQSDQLVIFRKNHQRIQSIDKSPKVKKNWLFYPETLPYENLFFRELFELALAIASFDEKVYFVVDGLAQHDLKQAKPEYSKNLAKMLHSAEFFDLSIIDQNQYQNLKNQPNTIEFN